MSKRTKILSMILAGILSLSLLAGCGQETQTNGEIKEQEKHNVKLKIEETEHDVVCSGKSDYFILIPDEATEWETYAAKELQLFLKEATGAEITIYKESEADKTGSFLSVGNTKASQDVDVMPSYDEVKSNGFEIKTVEDDCYLKGFSDIGTRNAVYEWLSHMIGWEIYADDEIVFEKTEDLKLLAFANTIVPSIEWRANNGPSVYNEELAIRARKNPFGEVYLHDRLVHNSMTFVDPTVYDYRSEEYKGWYSEKEVNGRPAQLCYSNADMQKVFIENLLKQLETATADVVILGMEDNVEWCTCSECTASKDKYGTNAAVMIKFANKVQEAVNVWNSENRENDTPIKCVFFAYYETSEPPVIYDEESKTYKPIDESVKLHEDLGVMFAPILASYSQTFDAEINADVKRQMEGWGALTDNLHAWTYAFHTGQNFICKNTFEIMQDNYKAMLENGLIALYDQTNGAQRSGETGWSQAQFYVQSKLMWDVNLNMEELLDDFFANYYAEASDTMRKIFDEERKWFSHIYNDLGAIGRINDNLLSAEYWSYPYLKSALRQFEKAYQDIEGYRETNPKRYQQLYERITLETIQYRYLLISLYGTEFTEAELLNMKLAFRKDAELLDLIVYKEGVSIEILWDEWGIK